MAFISRHRWNTLTPRHVLTFLRTTGSVKSGGGCSWSLAQLERTTSTGWAAWRILLEIFRVRHAMQERTEEQGRSRLRRTQIVPAHPAWQGPGIPRCQHLNAPHHWVNGTYFTLARITHKMHVTVYLKISSPFIYCFIRPYTYQTSCMQWALKDPSFVALSDPTHTRHPACNERWRILRCLLVMVWHKGSKVFFLLVMSVHLVHLYVCIKWPACFIFWWNRTLHTHTKSPISSLWVSLASV